MRCFNVPSQGSFITEYRKSSRDGRALKGGDKYGEQLRKDSGSGPESRRTSPEKGRLYVREKYEMWLVKKSSQKSK